MGFFMKIRYLLSFVLIFCCAPLLISQTQLGQYVIVGWNDLGMHCANKDFSSIVVLPPFNNLKAQVIKRGDANNIPHKMTTGYSVTYEVPGNTYSVGKTNFWTYANQLFGANLQPNIGLTGNGLTGTMTADSISFYATGIPLTPYTDANLTTEDPFQLALLKVYDANNNLLAQTTPVIPVSNEINCVSSGCHNSMAAIISGHEDRQLPTPVLCASCHPSNALGTTGPQKPLSQVIHNQHAGRTTDCYKCHPGPNTKCLRDTMNTAQGFVCDHCHGSMANVASTIANGRQPWLQEPSCNGTNNGFTCHTDAYAVNTGKLFRNSQGHSGIYCSGCHGSPHAIVTVNHGRDNVQNFNLQGENGTLRKCEVCHGIVPTGPGPHGIIRTEVKKETDETLPGNVLLQNFPNPFRGTTTIPFTIATPGKVKITICDERGNDVFRLLNEYKETGGYTLPFNLALLPSGVYFCRMTINGESYMKKLVAE
jgi:hypothetical protein